MRVALDPKQIVSSEELLVSRVVCSEGYQVECGLRRLFTVSKQHHA